MNKNQEQVRVFVSPTHLINKGEYDGPFLESVSIDDVVEQLKDFGLFEELYSLQQLEFGAVCYAVKKNMPCWYVDIEKSVITDDESDDDNEYTIKNIETNEENVVFVMVGQDMEIDEEEGEVCMGRIESLAIRGYEEIDMFKAIENEQNSAVKFSTEKGQ